MARFWLTQPSHTLAGRLKQPADQSQPKSVPAQPGKSNFKKCPHATEKEDKEYDKDRQIWIS